MSLRTLSKKEMSLRTPALLAASYELTFSYMHSLHFLNCLQVRSGRKTTTRRPYKQEAVDGTVRTEYTSRITAASENMSAFVSVASSSSVSPVTTQLRSMEFTIVQVRPAGCTRQGLFYFALLDLIHSEVHYSG